MNPSVGEATMKLQLQATEIESNNKDTINKCTQFQEKIKLCNVVFGHAT